MVWGLCFMVQGSEFVFNNLLLPLPPTDNNLLQFESAEESSMDVDEEDSEESRSSSGEGAESVGVGVNTGTAIRRPIRLEESEENEPRQLTEESHSNVLVRVMREMQELLVRDNEQMLEADSQEDRENDHVFASDDAAPVGGMTTEDFPYEWAIRVVRAVGTAPHPQDTLAAETYSDFFAVLGGPRRARSGERSSRGNSNRNGRARSPNGDGAGEIFRGLRSPYGRAVRSQFEHSPRQSESFRFGDRFEALREITSEIEERRREMMLRERANMSAGLSKCLRLF